MEASQLTLLITLAFAGAASIFGLVALKKGDRSKFTYLLMVGAFVAQCTFLYLRGELRGKCPLGDWAEILVFIAWSLSMFYLVIGSTYRVSLLGFFSAPLVALLCGVALVPGLLELNPVAVGGDEIDPWNEMHAALSVLSYGALALASVASIMFLALNAKLKGKQLTGGLFKNLPPVFELTALAKRLLWVGLVILTVGILCSLKMRDVTSHLNHVWAAVGVWSAYFIFLLWSEIKGMTPRVFAWICCGLFIVSLAVFGVL